MYSCSIVCACVYMHAHACHAMHVEVRGQLLGTGSSLSSYELQGLNRKVITMTLDGKHLYSPSSLAGPSSWESRKPYGCVGSWEGQGLCMGSVKMWQTIKCHLCLVVTLSTSRRWGLRQSCQMMLQLTGWLLKTTGRASGGRVGDLQIPAI